jgi:hypothetical protein
VHPTLGILARFQAFFHASAFFQSDGVPPPAPARVTQTVRPHGFLFFSPWEQRDEIARNQVFPAIVFSAVSFFLVSFF